MGPVVTQPVFPVSDKVIFKPACSANETSQKIEISLVACIDRILSIKRTSKVLIRLPLCAGWSAPLLLANPEDRFSRVEAQIILLLNVKMPTSVVCGL